MKYRWFFFQLTLRAIIFFQQLDHEDRTKQNHEHNHLSTSSPRLIRCCSKHYVNRDNSLNYLQSNC